MKVWLLVVGEPLPIDEGNPRFHRGGILAAELVKRGHDVTWFTSTTNHFKKELYFNEDKDVRVSAHLLLKFLSAPLYTRNVSPTRFYNHHVLGQKFKAVAETLEKPDVIIAAMPTLELSSYAVAYGRKHNVPVVVDIRDLWPDVFLEVLPSILRPFFKPFLWPMYSHLKRAMRATSVVGITQKILAWGRKPLKNDKVFYLGYESPQTQQNLEEAGAFWDALGVKEKTNTRYMVYIGNMNKRCDLEIAMKAARVLKDRQDIVFVICGDGEDRARLQSQTQDLPQVIFSGWVNKGQIQALLKRAHGGLMPYPNSFDFQMSIPNKVVEYWSEGLPIASVLQGYLQEVMDKEQVGLTAKVRTPEAYAQTILDMLSDDARYQTMRKNALSFFENFRAEKVYAEYADHLEALAKAGKF